MSNTRRKQKGPTDETDEHLPRSSSVRNLISTSTPQLAGNSAPTPSPPQVFLQVVETYFGCLELCSLHFLLWQEGVPLEKRTGVTKSNVLSPGTKCVLAVLVASQRPHLVCLLSEALSQECVLQMPSNNLLSTAMVHSGTLPSERRHLPAVFALLHRQCGRACWSYKGAVRLPL